MNVLAQLQQEIKEAVAQEYDFQLTDNQLVINSTKKEFEGEYTFVTFPLVMAL